MDVIPELNNRQLDRLSEFLANLSIVIVASLIIPNVFNVDKLNLFELVLGVVFTLSLLITSLVVLRQTYD